MNNWEFLDYFLQVGIIFSLFFIIISIFGYFFLYLINVFDNKVNKKEKQAVVKSLLIEKIIENNTIVLKVDDTKIEKTKQIADFFNSLKIQKKRVLIIAKPEEYNQFKRCIRNIPKKDIANINSINGYNLALCQNLVVMETAVDDMNVILKKGSKK